MRICAAVLLLLSVASATAAQEAPAPDSDIEEPTPVELPPDERLAEEVDVAERLGHMLYTHSRLIAEAQAAAEVVVDRRALGSAQQPIVVAADGRWLVRFVGAAGSRVVSYYDVVFTAEGVAKVRLLESAQNVTAEEASRYVATQAATRGMPFRCEGDYLKLVVPAPEGSGWLVYLLPHPLEDDIVQIGGHLRAEASRNGQEITTIGALTAGCTTGAVDGPGEADEAGDGFWIMHTRSSAPHEVHVYLSLLHDAAFKVGTWSGAWDVDRGEVRFAYTWEDRPR